MTDAAPEHTSNTTHYWGVCEYCKTLSNEWYNSREYKCTFGYDVTSPYFLYPQTTYGDWKVMCPECYVKHGSTKTDMFFRHIHTYECYSVVE